MRTMNKNNDDSRVLKILKKVEEDLREIQFISGDYKVKEKISMLLEFIEEETINNKEILEKLIYNKIKETKGRSPELNTDFYLLYRKFSEGKISIQEAQRLYDSYEKEIRTIY